MSKDDVLEIDGVVEFASNGKFKVRGTSEGMDKLVILCTLSGKIRMNAVKILIGDKVKVEVSAYDLTKGRIIYRYKT